MGETTIIERIGHVLGWTGSGVAVLLAIPAVTFLIVGAVDLARGEGFHSAMSALFPGLMLAVFALLAFLVGRALLYILAGPRRR